jgi:glycine/D-amino acid oxidase-like deaminating enzyme
MTDLQADVVICGAGIAGVAAAYHLSVRYGVRNILLLERDAPFGLTSDKSGECYRNWWPGPVDDVYGGAMVRLMNRSIDLLEDTARTTGNRINLNRRGYVYATADQARIPALREAAEQAAYHGAGPVRLHDQASSSYLPSPAHGFDGVPDGADLILEPGLIRRFFPALSEDVVAILHARRCGWFGAQQLGMVLLEQAREHGVRLMRAEVTGVDVTNGRVNAVELEREGQAALIKTSSFVNAAGPCQQRVARMMGLELPVFSERHIKSYFNDHLGVIPRDAPLLIWMDDMRLPWTPEEREVLAEDDSTRWLLETLPGGVHCRPEGHGSSTTIMANYSVHAEPVPESFPIRPDPQDAELALRALSVMLPGLQPYLTHAPKPNQDGGYYTKTIENRPLIGPLPVQGAYIIGAMSGFGLMASHAAGDLLAAHITLAPLPEYAPAFALSRYDDPAYQRLLQSWSDGGQL